MKNRDRVLSFVRENPGCTQQQISKALRITPDAQVNQKLHDLMQKGLVYRDEQQRPYKYYPEKGKEEDTLKNITKDRNRIWLEPKPGTYSEGGNTRNEDDLIANIDHWYERSLEIWKKFGGPSVYFHVQAIKEQATAFLSDRHVEMIYATLASWGMHKMGDPDVTKTKMVEFPEFKEAIIQYRDQLRQSYYLRMDSCSQEQYQEYVDNLRQIYCALKVSISDATIVAHSKTLAHILPNLIPPVDGMHTVRFFTQDKKDFFTKAGKYRAISLPHNIGDQFSDFKKYCCRIKMLFDRSDHQLFIITKKSFNTSFPKIMDNLILAFVKDVPKPEKDARE